MFQPIFEVAENKTQIIGKLISPLITNNSFHSFTKSLLSWFLFFCRHCRKGKVGGYRDDLSAEWIEKFDVWTAEQLRDSDFKFSQ